MRPTTSKSFYTSQSVQSELVRVNSVHISASVCSYSNLTLHSNPSRLRNHSKQALCLPRERLQKSQHIIQQHRSRHVPLNSRDGTLFIPLKDHPRLTAAPVHQIHLINWRTSPGEWGVSGSDLSFLMIDKASWIWWWALSRAKKMGLHKYKA